MILNEGLDGSVTEAYCCHTKKKTQNKTKNDLSITLLRESFKFLRVRFHGIQETITLFRDSARLRITKSRESFTFLRGHFHVITGNYHVISCL